MIQKIITIMLLILTISCTKGQSKIEEITLHSKSLENSILKVKSDKKLIIYLPPSYEYSNKEYPVIYYLPGFTSPIKDLMNGEYEGFKLQNELDNLINNNNLNEMVVVLCSGKNYLGGNFYVNSPLTGNNEDYIVKDVVNYIDENYRTIKNSNSRGIAGHSMGGFGAFNIITKHPDVFSVCYAMSPGIYDNSGLHKQKLFKAQRRIDYLNGFLSEIYSNQKKAKPFIEKRMNELFDKDYDHYYYGFTFAYVNNSEYDVQNSILLSENDTSWKFGKFLKRNINRQVKLLL